MARFNSTFNYITQVQGETIWERIKTLKGFLNGRKRAVKIQEKTKLEKLALEKEIQNAIDTNQPEWEVLRLKSKLIDFTCWEDENKELMEETYAEIKALEKLLAELYSQVERYTHEDGTPYTDDEMFEANSETEFLAMAIKEIQADILATGRPNQMHIRWLMRTPKGVEMLKQIPGLNAENMRFMGLLKDETELFRITGIPEDKIKQLTSMESTNMRYLLDGGLNENN